MEWKGDEEEVREGERRGERKREEGRVEERKGGSGRRVSKAMKDREG